MQKEAANSTRNKTKRQFSNKTFYDGWFSESLSKSDKTRQVMNDPLGQPTAPAGSDCRMNLKFWDVRTDGHSV